MCVYLSNYLSNLIQSNPIQSGWWFFATTLKNMNSPLGMILPNVWENKKCSKPPTSNLSISISMILATDCDIRDPSINQPVGI